MADGSDSVRTVVTVVVTTGFGGSGSGLLKLGGTNCGSASLPLTAISVAKAPKMYFDMSESSRKNCLSAGAMPDIGCVTNTTEYIDRVAIMPRIAQNVMPIANFR